MPGNGGKRSGAGRKKGSKSKATIEKEAALAEVRQRIMKISQRILDSQVSIAIGQQFLFRIDTETDSKGKKTRSKPVLVTSEEEIQNYLDGEYGDGESSNDESSYYFITTKEPNNMAIDSMMNRAFGKPTETVEMTGKNGEPIAHVVILPERK